MERRGEKKEEKEKKDEKVKMSIWTRKTRVRMGVGSLGREVFWS